MGPPRGSNDPEEVKKLQAVIIADSFNENFRPITLETPRVLMPIVNIPIIEYSLEFLESNEIEEVFVFCCYHANQIVKYLENSRWKGKVKTVIATDSLSVGDALRTINATCVQTGLIKGEFVLVFGDIISNIKIGKHLAEFRQKRIKDKSLVMNMFFKVAPPGHRTRTALDDLIVGLDSNTQQVLYYEDDRDSAELTIPTAVIDSCKSMQLRHDLLDCGVYLCAPEVLYEFEDNFDYVDIASSFVADALTSEISDFKITATVVESDYAARIQCLKTYDSISRDIVQRWTFPLVPETNLYRPKGVSSGYRYERNSNYKANQVKVARTAQLIENVVVGEFTEIGEGSVIVNCTIGKHCKIGANVKLTGAYLWDNVEVSDDVTITASLLASRVKIGAGATVSKGCILAPGVEIGDGFTLPEYSRMTVSSASNSDDLYDEEDITASQECAWKEAEVGVKGAGRVWPDQSYLDGNTIAWQQVELPPSAGNEDLPSSDEDDDELEIGHHDNFAAECKATVRDGLEKNSTAENHVLEINSLKFSYDATFEDCYQAFAPVLFDHVEEGTSVKDFVGKFIKFFTEMKELFRRFCNKDKNRVELIEVFTRHCEELTPTEFGYTNGTVFTLCLKAMYDLDILTEESVLMWSKKHAGSEWVTKAKSFLDWLEEAEEDESDEEESD